MKTIKSRTKGTALVLPLCFIGAFLLGSATCSQNQSPSVSTTQVQSALNTGVTDIVALAKAYQSIGEPGLPTKDSSLFNGLTSAAAQLQTQVGQPANPAMINTGVPATDQVVANIVVPGATVTQANVNTVQAAATQVAPTAPTSMILKTDPHYSVTVYDMLNRLDDQPIAINEPEGPNGRSRTSAGT